MLRKVQVKNGVLQGLVGKDPRITVFRGVPYAKPPVGELRWRAPQPAENWEGVRKCYEYGDMPMMRVHPGTGDDFYTKELHPVAADYGMSEDCLYLNIFHPRLLRMKTCPYSATSMEAACRTAIATRWNLIRSGWPGGVSLWL